MKCLASSLWNYSVSATKRPSSKRVYFALLWPNRQKNMPKNNSEPKGSSRRGFGSGTWKHRTVKLSSSPNC